MLKLLIDNLFEMEEQHIKILSSLNCFWNDPDFQDSDLPENIGDYYYYSGIDTVKILNALKIEYEFDDIQKSITIYLKKMGNVFWSQIVPDQALMNLAGYCLSMVGEDAGVCISLKSVKHIVRTFPYPIWHAPVSQLTNMYLSDKDLLESLKGGLSLNEEADNCIGCLEAIGFYHGKVKNVVLSVNLYATYDFPLSSYLLDF